MQKSNVARRLQLPAQRLSLLLAFFLIPSFTAAAEPDPKLTAGWAPPFQTLQRNQRARLQAAHQRANAAWREVHDRAGWEKFRDAQLAALRKSLGDNFAAADYSPASKTPPTVHVTGSRETDGYRVDNVVYASRWGLLITANLYTPTRLDAVAAKSKPGILISHSHHSPKTEGELQDMGATWAKAGCVVLVPDHLGHGERAEHPFRAAGDFSKPFKVGRQDYYFRYNTGIQLSLLGESLIGQFVYDLHRGIDVLLAQPGIDPKRIILLGAVAGGGDPAGIAAALDERIAVVAPFNFGGPQPDYAIPENTDRDFPWFGVPYWESSRWLPGSARDGLAQWTIAAAVAPRHLIYAHEFAWDEARDPAWPRVQQVYQWYDAADKVAPVMGQGNLKGRPPESSHCNNIGPLHRSRIYPLLEKWLGMPIPTEHSERRTAAELACLTPEARERLKPLSLSEAAVHEADRRIAAHVASLEKLSPEQQLAATRSAWAKRLGPIEPMHAAKVLSHESFPDDTGAVDAADKLVASIPGAQARRMLLQTEPNRDDEPNASMVASCLLLTPSVEAKEDAKKPAVIVMLSRSDTRLRLLWAVEVKAFLEAGCAVCFVDMRGTGELQPKDGSPGRGGVRTDTSATEWQFGQTLLAGQLRDLRCVLQHLRDRDDVEGRRVAIWGDPKKRPNPTDAAIAAPLDALDGLHYAEPFAGLLAMLTALYEPEVKAVAISGGLTSYQSLLESPFVYIPHDAIVPGALAVGDLPQLAAALAPGPLLLQSPVNGRNQKVPQAAVEKAYQPATAAYRARDAEDRFQFSDEDDGDVIATWLIEQIR